MSTRSLSASLFSTAFLASAATLLFALPALAGSQARIVRLSDVQGSVQIDKNTGLGFENAFVNLPVTQGTQLRTADNGRAEIEFEDGSSMRLGPNSMVEFSTLGLSDSGTHISQVNLTEGMAYVNWLGKGDDFTLNFAHEKVSLDHPAHFRVDTSSDVANLAVFKGDVDVEGPSGKVTVEKKKTAVCESQDDKCAVEDRVTEAALDSWDKQASAYHDQYAKNNTSPYGYGVSDLNYYGAYSSVPGYGMMWQPYFTGVGWDPFMDGAWGFYPGFGYMFASAYPWGWLPYRYGNWAFVPGYGWGWQPGGWNNVLTVPRYSAASTVHVTQLVPPAAGTSRTVVVGRGGAVSTQSPHIVNAGSAGFGIARGSVGNLGHLNHQVAKNGFAEVHPAPQFASSSGSGRGSSGFGQGRPSSSGSSSGSSASHSSPSFHSSSSSSGGHASSPGSHH